MRLNDLRNRHREVLIDMDYPDGGTYSPHPQVNITLFTTHKEDEPVTLQVCLVDGQLELTCANPNIYQLLGIVEGEDKGKQLNTRITKRVFKLFELIEEAIDDGNLSLAREMLDTLQDQGLGNIPPYIRLEGLWFCEVEHDVPTLWKAITWTAESFWYHLKRWARYRVKGE